MVDNKRQWCREEELCCTNGLAWSELRSLRHLTIVAERFERGKLSFTGDVLQV